MTFIAREDYDASIHREVLDALARGDDAVVMVCEERAIAEMRGYLSARYDADAIFAARGADRHPLVLMMAIDIAVYHLFCLHNPQKMSQLRRDRYERAVEWLRQVAAYKVSIDGAPLLPADSQQRNNPIQITSNPKRTQHL